MAATLQGYANNATNRGEVDLGDKLRAFSRVEDVVPQNPAQARAILAAGTEALRALNEQLAVAIDEVAALADRCQALL